MQPAWSPQATPLPVLKAACTLGWFSTIAAAVSNAPIRLTGLSGSANTNACSGVSENRPPLMVDVARGRLRRRAIRARSAARSPRPSASSSAVAGPISLEGVVEAERIADPHQRHADRAAKVAKHAAHEFIELRFVDLCHVGSSCHPAGIVPRRQFEDERRTGRRA